MHVPDNGIHVLEIRGFHSSKSY